MLDVVKAFEDATGITIPYEIVERRPGDVPRLEACPKRAAEVLGWSAKRLLRICVATGGPGNPPIPMAIDESEQRPLPTF